MNKVNAWRHRIHTEGQARRCRKIVEIERLRWEETCARQKLELAQKKAAQAQQRQNEIIQSVLSMTDVEPHGDTAAIPKVYEKPPTVQEPGEPRVIEKRDVEDDR